MENDMPEHLKRDGIHLLSTNYPKRISTEPNCNKLYRDRNIKSINHSAVIKDPSFCILNHENIEGLVTDQRS